MPALNGALLLILLRDRKCAGDASDYFPGQWYRRPSGRHHNGKRLGFRRVVHFRGDYPVRPYAAAG